MKKYKLISQIGGGIVCTFIAAIAAYLFTNGHPVAGGLTLAIAFIALTTR